MAFFLMRDHLDLADAFSCLGEGNKSLFDLLLFDTSQEFTCKIYGLKQCKSTDDARYRKFCSSKNKCAQNRNNYHKQVMYFIAI